VLLACTAGGLEEDVEEGDGEEEGAMEGWPSPSSGWLGTDADAEDGEDDDEEEE